MAGWHHWLDGCEFEWTLWVGDGQGGLACCNSWGRKESDTTEWLNWTEMLSIRRMDKQTCIHTMYYYSVIKHSELSNNRKTCVFLLSHFSPVQFFGALWTIAYQAPLSIGFSRQEYWSGLLCPPPGDLPDLGIKPAFPALQMNSLSLSHWGSP